MSTSPEDQIVNLLSHRLAGRVGDAELLRELGRVDADRLGAESRESLEELRVELVQSRARGDLERLVREALEALALGL